MFQSPPALSHLFGEWHHRDRHRGLCLTFQLNQHLLLSILYASELAWVLIIFFFLPKLLQLHLYLDFKKRKPILKSLTIQLLHSWGEVIHLCQLLN